jgi:hypothetical protein
METKDAVFDEETAALSASLVVGLLLSQMCWEVGV